MSRNFCKKRYKEVKKCRKCGKEIKTLEPHKGIGDTIYIPILNIYAYEEYEHLECDKPIK